MVVGLVLLAFCQIACTCALVLGVRLVVNRKQREIEARLAAVFTEWCTAEPGKASKLAELVAAAGAVVGQSAAQSIMAAFNADKSHVARQANMLADEAQAQANPLLGLLAGGKRGKGAALMRLAELLGPMLVGQGNKVAGSNGESSSVRNRLGTV